MTTDPKNIRNACLAVAAALALAGCSSTVVRETAPVSVPKYGASTVVKRGDTVYRIATNNGISPLDLATVRLGLGDTDTVLALLGQAVQAHDGGLVFLAVDPRYEPVRRDPRFQCLLRRIGFPDSLTVRPPEGCREEDG